MSIQESAVKDYRGKNWRLFTVASAKFFDPGSVYLTVDDKQQ